MFSRNRQYMVEYSRTFSVPHPVPWRRSCLVHALESSALILDGTSACGRRSKLAPIEGSLAIRTSTDPDRARCGGDPLPVTGPARVEPGPHHSRPSGQPAPCGVARESARVGVAGRSPSGSGPRTRPCREWMRIPRHRVGDEAHERLVASVRSGSPGRGRSVPR